MVRTEDFEPATYHETHEPRLARIHARLALDPRYEPLAVDAESIRLFGDYDLASLVENRCGVQLDPDKLDAAERHTWLERATNEDLDRPGAAGTRCYWVRAGAERVGTIAYRAPAFADKALLVTSVYVAPAHRRRGYARAALLALRDAAFAEGMHEIRLETYWSWESAVRFYSALGMWVCSWARNLTFAFLHDMPRWNVLFDGDCARFIVGDDKHELIYAQRATSESERLDWSEVAALDPRNQSHVHGQSTFALVLAVNGWPLLRSDRHWQQQLELGFSDMAGPEGLAFKIRHYEAWEQKHGFRVTAPRIPGLDYPTWDELERNWESRPSRV